MLRPALCIALIGSLLQWPRPSHAHGRLWDPPGRSTMSKRGFNVPANYDDNQLYCGGFSHQVSLGYKCGLCGDPWDGERENEAGGIYATGQISRAFYQGDVIPIMVQITANHKGYFEFKICPVNDPNVKATQECLDSHQLTLADGSGSRYYVTTEMGNGMFNMTWVLPSDVTCSQCVLQWRYHAGNNWGTDPDTGRGCLGCGYQEEFYGCADIQIVLPGQTLPTTLLDQQTPSQQHTSAASGGNQQQTVVSAQGAGTGNSGTQNGTGNLTGGATQTRSGNGEVQTEETSNESSSSTNTSGTGSSGSGTGSNDTGTGPSTQGVMGDNIVCQGVRSDLDTWCQLNCQGGYCPPEYCTCEQRQYQHSNPQPQGCRGAGIYADLPGYTTWCRQNCAMGYCPSFMCVC